MPTILTLHYLLHTQATLPAAITATGLAIPAVLVASATVVAASKGRTNVAINVNLGRRP